MTKILALDLGTNTGFAIGDMLAIVSGHWNLKPGRYDGGGMRFVKFRSALNELYSAWSIERVYYEEVRRHAGTDAAHVYGGLMATLTAWCEEKGIPYSSLPVGAVKKNWTGKGNASKAEMIAEAEIRGFKPQTEDEADALAVFDLALQQE